MASAMSASTPTPPTPLMCPSAAPLRPRGIIALGSLGGSLLLRDQAPLVVRTQLLLGSGGTTVKFQVWFIGQFETIVLNVASHLDGFAEGLVQPGVREMNCGRGGFERRRNGGTEGRERDVDAVSEWARLGQGAIHGREFLHGAAALVSVAWPERMRHTGRGDERDR